jgi:hypothetical protein
VSTLAPRLVVARSTVPPVDRPGAGEAEVWLAAGGAVVARSGTVGRERWVDVPTLGEFVFDEITDEVRAHVRARTGLARVRDTYRRAVLPMILQARGIEVLHASAVLTERGVLALAGPSGVGKSTLAMGLAGQGHRPWADDAVGWDVSDGVPRVLPLPFGLRLRPPAAAFFGREPGNRGADKVEIGRFPRAPSRHPASLAAVCVLERGPKQDGAVVIEKLHPSGAFRALLPHAFCFDLGDAGCKRRVTERYLELAGRVPCFVVRFGSGLARLASLLDAVEREVIRPTAGAGEGNAK